VLNTWLASGRPVSGLARRVDAVAPPGAQWFRVEDLSDRFNIRRALAGIRTVIHLAARAHVMREQVADALSAYREVNVEGTRILLDEAVAAGVSDFVFVSSVKAMGERARVAWTEASQPCPSDAYGVTKLEAERLVQDVAHRTGMRAIILRFPLVYGEGMRGNMLQLFSVVARGWPLPFRSVRNCRSYLYVANAVAAIETVLTCSAVSGEVFLVSDGANLSTPDLIRAVGRALARRPRLIPMPTVCLRFGARLGDVIVRLRDWPFTSESCERLLGSLVIDSSKLRTRCGYQPPFTVAEGLHRTAEWFRATYEVARQ
jgi:nucleoside-diphosphate-sugar epimerase